MFELSRSGKLTGDLLEESQRSNAVSTSDIGSDVPGRRTSAFGYDECLVIDGFNLVQLFHYIIYDIS